MSSDDWPIRWFPWLGIKSLTEEEAEFYGLDTDYEFKALCFEWGSLCILIWGRGKLKESDGNRRM